MYVGNGFVTSYSAHSVGAWFGSRWTMPKSSAFQVASACGNCGCVPGFVENGEVPVRVPAGDRVRDPARVAAELGAVRARGGRQAEGRLEREAVEALVAVAQLA